MKKVMVDAGDGNTYVPPLMGQNLRIRVKQKARLRRKKRLKAVAEAARKKAVGKSA